MLSCDTSYLVFLYSNENAYMMEQTLALFIDDVLVRLKSTLQIVGYRMLQNLILRNPKIMKLDLHWNHKDQ